MALMRAARRLGLLLVAVVFLGIAPTVAVAEDTVAFTIKDARITESSGLAVDPTGNLYWTVNDSVGLGAQTVFFELIERPDRHVLVHNIHWNRSNPGTTGCAGW